MNTVCKINKCNGCMACIEKCPKNCITISDDIFSYNAVKDEKKCVNCGICESVCPRNTKTDKNNPYQWYQGWADDQTRRKSSSGGAASTIMRKFIADGGYVASCRFKDGQFAFELTNDFENARRFAGSKYVKSNPLGIYKAIEKRIVTDKVLFIGLPCQVAGLKNYLKDDSNLYTIDLICHGTPSPKLLKSFLLEHKIDIDKVEDIQFRNSISMGLVKNGIKICPEGTDDYLLTFLGAVDYTENCYHCDYATFDRLGDLTLGDSWGTEYHDEEKKGISLILVNSPKGEALLNDVSLKLLNVDIDKAVMNNHQLSHPSVLKPEREKFLKRISLGKSFSSSTFVIYKKTVLKRNLKTVLLKFHILRK